jgi:lipid II:glycine glycyltransferase (peptidoglycan interpeptide bridge formation enzyme)
MNGLVSDGVSTFKRGFADHEDKLVGTYDKPLSPLYVIYAKILPLGKKLMRAIKRK